MGVFGKKKSAGSAETPSSFRKKEVDFGPFSLKSTSFARMSMKTLLSARKKSFHSEADSPASVKGGALSSKSKKEAKNEKSDPEDVQHHTAKEQAMSPTMAAIHAITLQMELQNQEESKELSAAEINPLPDRPERKRAERGPAAVAARKTRGPSSSSLSEQWMVDYQSLAIGKTIGHSSFGAVHEGKLNGTKVAIKTIELQPDTPNGKANLGSIKKEAELNCNLRHPNVVLFMGISIQLEKVCIVTELMSRGNVRDLLVGMVKGRQIRLDWSLRQQWALDTALGVGYLHSLDPPMIHRDLKTTNLLVDRGMKVKICDFGLSRFKSDKLMSAVGTVHFAAPEVLRNEKYTEKADVFSFGTVMWELWSRQCVFDGLPQISVYQKVVDGNMPDVGAGCDKTYKSIMNDCWGLDTGKRPSFAAIIDRLSQLVDELEERDG